jgi:hypothetical protein
VIYSRGFVLDAGEAEDAAPADGALWLSVVDVNGDGAPELLQTFIDPRGEPLATRVIDVSAGHARELGSADAAREGAARRLRSRFPVPRRNVAEALVRLEPESVSARLALLSAVDALSSSQWWGFYSPGGNNFVALHAGYCARHGNAAELAALGRIPSVAAFLARWSLTTEQLGSHTDPVVPPNALWGRAFFLDPEDASTAFSFFRLK